MGVSLAKPKAKVIISEYVATLPKFPAGVSSANDIYNFYLTQALVEEMGVYNDIRFQRKFKEVASTPQEYHELNHLSAQINNLTKKLFDKRNAPPPVVVAETPVAAPAPAPAHTAAE